MEVGGFLTALFGKCTTTLLRSIGKGSQTPSPSCPSQRSRLLCLPMASDRGQMRRAHRMWRLRPRLRCSKNLEGLRRPPLKTPGWPCWRNRWKRCRRKGSENGRKCPRKGSENGRKSKSSRECWRCPWQARPKRRADKYAMQAYDKQPVRQSFS